MKKRITLPAFIAIIIFCFTACNKQNIKTKSFSLNEKYYLSETDTTQGALTASIEVELPVFNENNQAVKLIFNKLISEIFGEMYLDVDHDTIPYAFYEDFKAEYIDVYENIKEDAKDKVFSLNYDLNLDGFSLLNDKNIFSYGIERHVYLGGAHGNSTRKYFNFNAQTGLTITENDIFIENSNQELSKIIKTKFVEDSEVLKSLEELEQSSFWADSIKPNSNFYISDEAITYVYNPYEIGLGNIEVTEVELPYELIRHLLKPESIISYFLKK